MWDWRGYITLAASLQPKAITTNDQMAAARASVSRAYYGAYHVTWEYVLGKNYIPYSTNHAVVWQELMKHKYSRTERKVGQDGAMLYGWRQKVDYVKDVVELMHFSNSASTYASDICRLLGSPIK